MTSKLRITHARFSEAELTAWRNQEYSLLKNCFRPLKQILRKKARARPGRRFFGEAHVAANEQYLEGWYGSFKWLTSSKWCGSQKLADPYQSRFRDALKRHFPDLEEFQDVAKAMAQQLKGRRPVGPDLWLTTADKHRFVEVKLPGDSLGQHQLLGLAVIAMFLRSDRPISVEVVSLYSDQKPERSDELLHEFGKVRAQLDRAFQVRRR